MMIVLTFLVALLKGGTIAAIIALPFVLTSLLSDLAAELRQVRFALEDMIRDDMEHATPECARCGAECVNPQCVAEVASR